MKKIITSMCIISSVLLVSSCTNEKPGSSFKSAIKIEDPLQGNIRSTLSDVGGEYYRFTIQENTNMSFEYAGPSNYCYSLSRYSEPEVLLKEVVSEGFSMELFPSTYYIHVYVKEENHLSNEEYKITHTGTKVEDEKGVHVPKGSREAYKLAVWENNSIPKGYKRYSEEGSGHVDNVQYLNKNEVDPMYYENNNENGKLKDEAYLDSILYIWDVDMMLSLSKEIENIDDKIDIKLYQETKGSKELSEIVIPIIEEYKKESKANDFIKNLIIDLYEGLAELSKIHLYASGHYKGTLINLSSTIDNYNKKDSLGRMVVQIPCYYQLLGKKEIKIATMCYGRRIASELMFWTKFKGSILNNNQIFSDDKLSGGRVTVLKNEEEYESHKRGVEINNKPIHSYGIDVDGENYTPYDDKYHKGYCGECEDYGLIEHVFTKQESEYKCRYCQYKKSNLQTSTIVASTMPFADSFSNEVIEEDIVDSEGNTIKTKRLRTGMLEGYLTMSSISNDADKAYIEYHFDKPITSIKYYIGLWGPDECFALSTDFKIEVLIDEDWMLVDYCDVNDLSKDRNDLKKKILELESSFKSVRFVVEDKKNSSDWNRGRVVLGDIEFTYLV